MRRLIQNCVVITALSTPSIALAEDAPTAPVLDARPVGNAIGIGLADFITQRVVDKIDWHSTNTNSIVSGFLQRSMVPVVCPTDQAGVDTAYFMLRRKPPEEVRVLRIRDTLHLEHLWLSDSFLPEAREHPRLEVTDTPRPLAFDSGGSLI